MNAKRILFVGMGIIIIALIAITYFGTGIGVKMLDHEQEANNSSEIDSRDLEWTVIQSIREEYKRIVREDEKVKELRNGKTFCGIYSIIDPNETYVVGFYRIGGHYEKTISNGCEGHRMVGGKIYKFTVDLNNETVKFFEEVKNQTLLNMIERDDTQVIKFERCTMIGEKLYNCELVWKKENVNK